MPLYEYHCVCNRDKELCLSFEEGDKPQVCECGKTMQRKMSVSSFTIKPVGKQMALDTLNSKRDGMPDRHWKPAAERIAASGL